MAEENNTGKITRTYELTVTIDYKDGVKYGDADMALILAETIMQQVQSNVEQGKVTECTAKTIQRSIVHPDYKILQEAAAYHLEIHNGIPVKSLYHEPAICPSCKVAELWEKA